MAFTFIASVTGSDAGITDTVDASSALNVQAGDLLVAWTEWQNAGSGDTVTVDENDGTDTFVLGTAAVNSNDIGGQFSWLLSSPTDASFTPRMTVSASSRRLVLIVLQFRPDSGETVTLDVEGTPATGSGTALASGNISTDGTDNVVVGGASIASGSVFSSHEIDSTAATEEAGAAGWGNTWWRILSSTFADGNATVTANNSDLWVCNIVAFKSVADVNVLATTDILTLTTYQATVNAETSISANTDALTLTTYSATIQTAIPTTRGWTGDMMGDWMGDWMGRRLGTNIQASTTSLTLTEYSATIDLQVNVSANVVSLTLTEYQANVNADTFVETTTDALTLTAYNADVNIGPNIDCGVVNLTLTTYQATVDASTNVLATTDALVLTEYSATVNADISIVASTDALSLTALNAAVSLDVNVSGSTVALSLTEYSATVVGVARSPKFIFGAAKIIHAPGVEGKVIHGQDRVARLIRPSDVGKVVA